MDDEEGLRERNKRATRRAISDAATELFTARGFDEVTVSEIAAAAKVSRMTVHNYFARKEDLFFDRDDEGRDLLRAALVQRSRGESPLEALRDLSHRLVEERHPFAKFTAGTALFWRTVQRSPALRARAVELQGELEGDLARMLAESVGAPHQDPLARLFVSMLVAAWKVAYAEALRRHRAGDGIDAVRALFSSLLDRAFALVLAGAKGTVYA
jgi:AcrR family transcriptional regulator